MVVIDARETSEFYIEQVEDLFIEKSATYSEDGRFLTSMTDSNFNKTTYETDPTTGLTTKSTNAKGISTNYTYDTKKQVTSAAIGNKTVNYTYNNQNLLSKIVQGGKQYGFEYDDFLNKKKVTVNDTITLVTNSYEENNGNLETTTYGNNQQTTFDYDDFDRIKSIHQMDDDYHYKYDNNGNLAKVLSNSHITKYYYDISKRLYRYRKDQFKINYTYDSNSLVTNKKYKLENKTNVLENIIGEDNKVAKTILDNTEIHYIYDSLGRIKERKIGSSWNELYQYVSNGKRTSDLVKSIQIGSDQYRYCYDALNNITDIYKNNIHQNHYEYDAYNELILEKNFNTDEQIEYTYDASGNLLTKKTVCLSTNNVMKTDTYQYANPTWEDQLTSYNGTSITYDAIGNPLTIGNDITMAWINGRTLSNYQNLSPNLNVSYKYNADGVRESKTVNNVETKYFLEGTDIIYEQRGNNIIYYLYDLTGPIGMKYNEDIYYYVKNLQKDIIGILNSNYEPIVNYEYDSWGKVVSIKDAEGNNITDSNHIGVINPFRYRSYYYDVETKLYYLNSRYYNPEWGRFLNADGILGANEDVLSYNLFVYVSNNPIVSVDPNGTSASALGLLAGAGIIAAGLVVLPVVTRALTGLTMGAVQLFRTTHQAVQTATRVIKEVSQGLRQKPKKSEEMEHNVYILRDKNTKKVEYVGRTKNIKATEYRHDHNPFRTGLKLEKVALNIDKSTARGLEQLLIKECRTLNRNPSFPRNNQIYGVAENNPHYDFYWAKAYIWASQNENLIPC